MEDSIIVFVVNFGCLAQLARAFGSYPKGRGFDSLGSHQRPVGQVVKTPPFHGGNTGSNPVRVISKHVAEAACFFYL